MAYDDVSGKSLDPGLVREARKVEMGYFRKKNMYTKVARAECFAQTGKGPVTTRWIDINKGDEANPSYRSRLVAREIKKDVRLDLFAATRHWKRRRYYLVGRRVS